MSFVPILVALGTSCAFELKRAAASKGPALAPDVAQLKASEARLKKLMTSLEKELAKEKSASAAEAEKAASAAGAAAQLREVQKEMRARIEAAEKAAKAAKGDVAGLEKKVAALEASNKATADRLAAALEALKAQVAAALAKHAAGGYGRAGADGLVSHLKKLGIDVDASPEALAALDAAPARGPASRAVAERLARLTAKGRAKVEEERARAAAAAPRLELSVDASTWARQLRLVTDDPERIARSLAAGAARAVSAVGGPALAAAGLLMPAAAAAAAGGGGGATTPPPRRATATLPVPPAAAAAASSSRAGGRKAIDAKPATTPAAPAPSATATVTVAGGGGGAGGGKAAAGAAPVKRRLLVLRAAAPAAAPAASRPSSHAVTTTPAKPSARPASPFDSLEAAARPVAAAGPATPRGASGFLPSFGGGMEEDDCRAIVPRG